MKRTLVVVVLWENKTNIFLRVEQAGSLLPLLSRSTLPFCSIRHLSLQFFVFKNLVKTFIQKIYTIIDQEVQEIQIYAFLLFPSNLEQNTSWCSQSHAIKIRVHLIEHIIKISKKSFHEIRVPVSKHFDDWGLAKDIREVRQYYGGC